MLDESIRALAHGIWLGITFPVDPELSVAMLQHLIDETPERSDGAAVAAALASYIVDLRAKDEQRENLQFFTTQLLGVDDKRLHFFHQMYRGHELLQGSGRIRSRCGPLF